MNSGDPDANGTSEFRHAIERFDRDFDFMLTAGVLPRTQGAADNEAGAAAN
jgi:hypothetical protein